MENERGFLDGGWGTLDSGRPLAGVAWVLVILKSPKKMNIITLQHMPGDSSMGLKLELLLMTVISGKVANPLYSIYHTHI